MLVMRTEFGESCQNNCGRRAAFEVAAQKFGRLEDAASTLGYTVSIGSIICNGTQSNTETFECGASIETPLLASDEERTQISHLIKLDTEIKKVIPSTQALILELES